MNSALQTDNESQSPSEQDSKIYWHLYRSRPWEHMVSLFDVLSKHFGKNYDEVAVIVAANPDLIHRLLSEWSSEFRNQTESVSALLTRWAKSYLYPKWYEEMPNLKAKHDQRGGPEEDFPEEAASFFCFMPFTEYFYALGYDYDCLKMDYTSEYGSELVADMKHDYGVTVKYPHLPLFGATLNGAIAYWPIEVIQVSVAVPLMLNLM